MNPFTQSITLSGRHATLEPLSQGHHDGLVEATRDGELWKLWYTSVPSPEGMGAEIERRLGLQQAGGPLTGPRDGCNFSNAQTSPALYNASSLPQARSASALL